MTFSCSCFKARRLSVPPKICSVYISHRSGNNSLVAAPTAALARTHSCRPRRGGLLSAWTCTPAQRLPGDSEGEEPNKRERESAEKERGRGTFGCGKMPSAHSSTQPRPAFLRLCTCKSVIRLTGVTQCSQEREHVLLFHFWLVFSERCFPLLLLLNNSSHRSIFSFSLRVSRLRVAPLLFHNSAVPLGHRGSDLWVGLRKETAANIQTGDTPIGNRTQHIQPQVLSEGP